ncbi:hypothetical protein [Streptomyces sp. NPDC094031]|uniref:hypothetical protein n=1 Tax=Streptomyces sp. NPDC094031 TaxID=3155307 RepID=UPI0033308EC0
MQTEARVGERGAGEPLAHLSWQEFLQITEVAMLEANPEAAKNAYAFTTFQTAQQVVQEFQDTVLATLGRAEEAEAEAPARTPSPPQRRLPTRTGSAWPSTCR